MLLLLYALFTLTFGARAHVRRSTPRVDHANLYNGSEFDFIVVGGGIAGLTVADRLTENPNVSVLVIEYGPFDKKEDSVMIPGAYFPVPYLWLPLMSVPQSALYGTSYSVPCGRVVGGGSVVNAMFFQRSDARLYNAWEELGASGWSWKYLLPYFKKSHKFHAPDRGYAAEHNITWDESTYGHDGPVQSSLAPYDYPGSANFYNAARSLGFQAAQDPNNGIAQGIFRLHRSVDPRTRTRSSARINHYDRVKARKNYHVLSETAVSRVIFEDTTATGVEVKDVRNGTTSTIFAKREVIISAGAVHTPQILQLSGIGDANVLKSLKINTISDLPGVGQNLQDHLMLLVHYNYTDNYFPNGGSLQSNASYASEQRALYESGKPSAFDLTASTGNLMLQLPLSNWTSKWQSILDLAKAFDPAAFLGAHPAPSVLSGYKKQRSVIIRELNKIAVSGVSWNTGPETRIYMTRPFSRGSVRLKSTNILDAPLIDYAAITDPTDLEILYSVYMKNRELMAAPDIAVLGPSEVDPAPGLTDESEIKESIKKALAPSNAHQCCTASMMKRDDGGVVDAQNLVYGTTRLSVVDASVWPINVGNAPQASIYAGAEKAADHIKKRHGLT